MEEKFIPGQWIPTRWEYHVEDLGHGDSSAQRNIANRLGNGGWELVSVVESWAYFKRMRTSQRIIAEEIADALSYGGDGSDLVQTLRQHLAIP